jgi:hypothetical protein
MEAIQSAVSLEDLIVKRQKKTGGGNPMHTVNKYNRRVSNQHIYNYIFDDATIFEFAVGSAQSSSAWKFGHAKEIIGIDIDSKTPVNVVDSDNYLKKGNPHVKTAYYATDMCTNLMNHPNLAVISKKFDIAVCNFAIHYAFRSEASFTTFLKNIVLFLKKDGYFIGTCLSSREIDKLPRTKKSIPGFKYECTEKLVKVTEDQTDSVVWSIDRSRLDNQAHPIYGNEITVDIVERPISHEFSIDLSNSLIIAAFKQHGFVYVPEEDFKRKPVLSAFKVNHDDLNQFEKYWADVHKPFVFQYTGVIEPKKLTLKRKVVPS